MSHICRGHPRHRRALRSKPPSPGRHTTLVALLPESKVSFDAALEEKLRTVSDDSRKVAGLEIGRAAAAAILKARENDGQNRTVEYTPGTKPGDYRPTPPDFTPAGMVQWGSVTPFVLKSAAQFRCPEPPAVDSSRARADLEEVKTIGGTKKCYADCRTKRDRPLLVRKFAPGLEPDRARSVRGTTIRRVGERTTVCAGESRDG